MLYTQKGFVKVSGGNIWYKIIGHENRTPLIMLHGGPEATPKTIGHYKSLLPHATMKIFKNSAHMTYLEEKSNYVETVQSFLKD